MREIKRHTHRQRDRKREEWKEREKDRGMVERETKRDTKCTRNIKTILLIFFLYGYHYFNSCFLKVAYCKYYKFKYCDSNIGLFSIAPHLVIALPTCDSKVVALNPFASFFV